MWSTATMSPNRLTTSTSLTSTAGTFVRTPGPVGERPRWDAIAGPRAPPAAWTARAPERSAAAEDMGASLRVSRIAGTVGGRCERAGARFRGVSRVEASAFASARRRGLGPAGATSVPTDRRHGRAGADGRKIGPPGATSVPTDDGRPVSGPSAANWGRCSVRLRPSPPFFVRWNARWPRSGGGAQSSTIASPPGSRPSRRAARHARVETGNRSTQFRMSGEDRPIVPCVGDQQDHPPDRPGRVASGTNAAFERLQVVQSGLGLDHLVDRRPIDHDVRAPQVAGDRHRHLCPPSQAGSRRAARRRSMSARWAASRTGDPDGKQTDSQIEAKYRWPRRAIRSTVTRCSSPRSRRPTAEWDRPDHGPDGPLTQAGRQSSDAQLLARPLTLPPPHPRAAQADAVVGSHAAIMSRGRLSGDQRGCSDSTSAGRGASIRSNGRPKDLEVADRLRRSIGDIAAFQTRPNDRSDVRWNAGGATARTVARVPADPERAEAAFPAAAVRYRRFLCQNEVPTAP